MLFYHHRSDSHSQPSISSVPSAVKIRPFSPEDLNAILEIQKACKHTPQWARDDYEKLVVDSRGMILVADLKDRRPPGPFGFAAFFQVNEEAELWNIAIAPQYQRQGVAKSLLRKAFRRLSDSGARSLFLEVRSSNTPAIGLYRSLGFRLLTSRRDYYQNPSEDALVLALRLFPPEA